MLRNATKISTITLVLVISLVYMYPFFTGDVISDGGRYLASTRNNIPEYYAELGNRLNQDLQIAKVASVPLSSETAYIWGNTSVQPNMDPILQYFIPNKSVIMTTTGNFYADRVALSLKKALDYPDSSFSQLGSLLRLWNVKYVIVHNDWHPYYSAFGVHQPYWYNVLLLSLTHEKSASLGFDGDSYLEVLDSSSVRFEKAFAVEVSVKPLATDNETIIVGQGTWKLQWQIGTGGDYFGLYLSGVSNGWIYSPILPTGFWYKVVGTYDGSKIRLFINNIKVAEREANGIMHAPDKNILLGKDVWSDRAFRGEIAGFKLYDESLNEEQINQLFKSEPSALEPLLQVSAEDISSSQFSLHKVTLIEQKVQGTTVEQPVRFGNLTMFSVRDPFPIIYGTSELVELPGTFNFTALTHLAASAVNSASFAAVFSQDKVPIPKVPEPIASTQNLNISFDMKSPTSYSVRISDVIAPFYLIFQESYDESWSATIDGQKLSDSMHFVSNGFGNGWFINRTGTFNVNLDFSLQQTLLPAKVFSLMVVLVIIALRLVVKKIPKLQALGNRRPHD